MDKVFLAEKPAHMHTYCDPQVVARHTGNHPMMAEIAGEFPLHLNADGDDTFPALDGEMTLESGGVAAVAPGLGERGAVPTCLGHRPRAVAEAQVLRVEPTGVPNTSAPRTAAPKEWI